MEYEQIQKSILPGYWLDDLRGGVFYVGQKALCSSP